MARILSISYDPSLLLTRQHLLERAGYAVTSVSDYGEATELCEAGCVGFELVILGHSIPHKHKEALVAAIRKKCDIAVLALLRPGAKTVAGANHTCDPGDPVGLVKCVRSIVEHKADCQPSL
jgi:DNA-binding response OmpR family regulator